VRVAAIDIGTNSFLCLIAEVIDGTISSILSDDLEIVRIGEGVNKEKKFSQDALQRADDCLLEFSKQIKKNDVQRIRAVATSAARDVSNGKALLDLGEKHGIPIEIIAGEKEADLTYKGVRSNSLFDKNTAVIDVGGGSTEIIFQNPDGKLDGISFNIGGVRLTEMFVTRHPTPIDEIEKMREYARKVLGKIELPGKYKAASVAGTPTTIAALDLKIEYTRDSLEGFALTQPKIEEWIGRLANLSLEQRGKLSGLEPKRADIIVAGAVILSESLRALGFSETLVSTRGVRFGVARELGEGR
jgi:exopolyphosphatase/guanosine-5'-triphosphate,3'-diphosphate pyrophosphatase